MKQTWHSWAELVNDYSLIDIISLFLANIMPHNRQGRLLRITNDTFLSSFLVHETGAKKKLMRLQATTEAGLGGLPYEKVGDDSHLA